VWNLGEEISNTIAEIKSFSDFFKQVDPYKHSVDAHTGIDSSLYTNLLGHPTFDGASLQTYPITVFNNTLRWVKGSEANGHKWIVTNDEQSPSVDGVKPDSVDPDHNDIRQNALWGNIMVGTHGRPNDQTFSQPFTLIFLVGDD
jgi:hypothetical protein